MTGVTLASAFAEPTVSPPRRWVALLSLASFGVWAGFFGPIQVLLAEQAELIDPANKEFVFGVVSGLGALVSVICNPLFGAFSDRTTLVQGRRVPWILGGAVTGAIALVLLSGADSLPTMALGWCLAQAALNAMLAAATAMVPDQVPVSSRGSVGGLLAIAQTLGVVGGVGIAAGTGSIATGYLVTAAVVVLTALPLCLRSRDVPIAAAPPFVLGEFARSFWISPRAHPDFGWAWITRFLVNLGNALGTLYLLFYLDDAVGYSDPDEGVFVLTAVYAGALMLTTVVFGAWSDRLGRRKPFVIWSGIVSACSVLALALSQTWPMAIVAAVILGCGYGIYTAVDFALITQVLPEAAARAKDLGVINIANALPQVLAPVVATAVIVIVRELGGSVVTDGDGFSVGYAAVYLTAAGCCLAGSLLVNRIRSVA